MPDSKDAPTSVRRARTEKDRLSTATRTSFLQELEGDRRQKEKVRIYAERRAAKASRKSIFKAERKSRKAALRGETSESGSPGEASSASEDESPETAATSALRGHADESVMFAADIESDEQTSGGSEKETDLPEAPSSPQKRESVTLTTRSRGSVKEADDIAGVATGVDSEKKKTYAREVVYEPYERTNEQNR